MGVWSDHTFKMLHLLKNINKNKKIKCYIFYLTHAHTRAPAHTHTSHKL